MERQVVGITPSPALVAPYLKMLGSGVPRVRVLERLLKAPAARDETVTDAYERLLRRVPSAAEGRAMATKLDRGGDLRTLLVALASSGEYYVGAGGGTAADFRNALRADLLGPTTPMLKPTGKPGRLGQHAVRARPRAGLQQEIQRPVPRGRGDADRGRLQAETRAHRRARNALQDRGGMTRRWPSCSHRTRHESSFAASERQAELARSPPPIAPLRLIGGASPSALTVPTLFGGALTFNPVSYADTFSGQPAPTVALPERVDQPGRRSGDLRGLVQRPDERALLQMQLSGNGQTFNVPILAVDANGKLTGGVFDVNAGGQLTPGMASPRPELVHHRLDTKPPTAIPVTLPTR